MKGKEFILPTPQELEVTPFICREAEEQELALLGAEFSLSAEEAARRARFSDGAWAYPEHEGRTRS